ncbi:MAG: type II toxin-antitoxin system Phd/YefM family antitoxin [Planctomycetia bacterium]|nr:type II toxin-antitoxin system Phd/YefM family antitoxin [Planctomycetia bacterium]
MTKASIRDLRTRFPHVRALIEREGEVLITDRGRAIMVIRPVDAAAMTPKGAVDYFARLKRLQPRPISSSGRRALDEADRGER